MTTLTDNRRRYLIGQIGLTEQEARVYSNADLENLYDDAQTATAIGWTNIDLVNGWAQQGGVVPGWRKDSLGIVHGRGVISGGAGATSAGSIPAGSRPGAVVYFRWGVDNAGYVDQNGGLGAGYDATGAGAAGKSLDFGKMHYLAEG